MTRACLRLFEVAAPASGSTPSIVDDEDLGQAGTYLFYPAVTIDQFGNLFISYSESSVSVYPSALGVEKPVGAPAGSFGTPFVILQGQTYYQTTWWGDYSSAVIDPTDTADVWLTAEYMSGVSPSLDWGTATVEAVVAPTLSGLTPTSGPTGQDAAHLPAITGMTAGQASPDQRHQVGRFGEQLWPRLLSAITGRGSGVTE